jgi:S-adenosylmethionine synthetase
MYEKVNFHHPDKVADRIAGRLVDLAYTRAEGGWLKSNPRIAVEVLIGHGRATVIIETSLVRNELSVQDVKDAVVDVDPTISEGNITVLIAAQDAHLSENQREGLRVGDNGIFKGVPMTDEQKALTGIVKRLAHTYPSDGKFVIHSDNVGLCVIACQSKAKSDDVYRIIDGYLNEHVGKMERRIIVNPLGEWTGGTDVDTGATNRKLGSDMGDAVTGGGLMGKDLSKADVSVNICCHIMAQESGEVVTAATAIGDREVTFRVGDKTVTEPFQSIVEKARLFILAQYGSFEKFAEWGLIA